MYLGELCKPGVPCMVKWRGFWEVSWDGKAFGCHLTADTMISNDWELVKPKVTKVIDWPEGTWGFSECLRAPLYRCNSDRVIARSESGKYETSGAEFWTGIIDPKAEQEFKK